MPKFRYINASLFEGCVFGTNDKELAENTALSEDDFVIDTETGEWILSDGTRTEIKELEVHNYKDQLEEGGEHES